MGRPKSIDPTLRQLAEELGVSLTRVVQIERETLHRIRWMLGDEAEERVVDKRKRKGKKKV